MATKSSPKELPCDQPGSLIIATRALLAEQTDLPKLYADTGLPFYWLKSFADGTIKSPSVNRVQYLYEKLAGKKLHL